MDKQTTPPNTQAAAPTDNEVFPSESLFLVNKKISIKFAEYRINNKTQKMVPVETVSISEKGILFPSPVAFPEGALMRVWVELPDYWARKSQHVGYQHTEAPTHFQILGRVLQSTLVNKKTGKNHILCENINIDRLDAVVLNDFLGVVTPTTPVNMDSNSNA